jgi:hypothetical protein
MLYNLFLEAVNKWPHLLGGVTNKVNKSQDVFIINGELMSRILAAKVDKVHNSQQRR